jgi:uncharacterized membrane protein
MPHIGIVSGIYSVIVFTNPLDNVKFSSFCMRIKGYIAFFYGGNPKSPLFRSLQTLSFACL